MSINFHLCNLRAIALSIFQVWFLLLTSIALGDDARTSVTVPIVAPPPQPSVQRISGSIPEFPSVASRFNISGRVVARLYISKEGHVIKTEIVESPADILSNAVINATRDWEFTAPPGGETVTKIMGFPFKFSHNDEVSAFDFRVRPQKQFPTTAKDINLALPNGWVEFKLLIDRDGKPAIDTGSRAWDHWILKSSGDDLRKAVPAIISAMRFDSVAEGTTPLQSNAMNRFKVTVQDQTIQIEQFSGD